ncbi:Kunitz family trypsin and protease inhibitor protein [Abeliophyllum distichum]|uniref:Kunitz family trypsin and protease inhibitor protein n=1 Tax=Abeliophyllum distichum TaxID=126358 RepID=A0ABD1RAB1_9LAMI
MNTKSLFLPFFLLFILPNSLLGEVSKPPPDPVRDTFGKLVRTKFAYYILPLSYLSGGGFDLINTNNSTCPLDIVQSGYDTLGIPVAFFPVNLKKSVIRVFTDLNIMFPNKYTVCPETPVWKLDHYYPKDLLDPDYRDYFITTGGVVGNPGPETLANWFKIQKFEDGYKLLHCPNVCTNYCDVVCKDVGIYAQNGHTRLALTNVPFKVVFKRA